MFSELVIVLTHDSFVRIIGFKYLKKGWVVYAAHHRDFPSPPKIGIDRSTCSGALAET